MAELKFIEKTKLENFFEMDGGYVCDFNNRSFEEFFMDAVGINISDAKYQQNNSGSKANRMRSFWTMESDLVVSRLLDEMLEYWKERLQIGVSGYRPFKIALYDDCRKIISRIKSNHAVEDLDALRPNSDDRDFGILSASIHQSIKNNEFEQAIDRLHVFVVKYLRVLCKKRGLLYDKDTALNSLIGGYIKFLRENKLVESEMSMQILKSSIKVMEHFDFVRNNQSLAHDNSLLNKEESVLIFGYIANSIRFIKSIEDKIKEKPKTKDLDAIDMWDREPTDAEIDAAGDAWIQMQIDIRRGK